MIQIHATGESHETGLLLTEEPEIITTEDGTLLTQE